jgi:hypothetical protein
MEESILPMILIPFAERQGSREFTVPRNPQQNGVAERKNESIVKIVKSMVHDLDLPRFLWEEACCTIVYMLNKCPAQSVEGQDFRGSFHRDVEISATARAILREDGIRP